MYSIRFGGSWVKILTFPFIIPPYLNKLMIACKNKYSKYKNIPHKKTWQLWIHHKVILLKKKNQQMWSRNFYHHFNQELAFLARIALIHSDLKARKLKNISFGRWCVSLGEFWAFKIPFHPRSPSLQWLLLSHLSGLWQAGILDYLLVCQHQALPYKIVGITTQGT